MSRFLVYLGRMIIIVLGFMAASLAASAFLNLVIVGALDVTAEEMPWVITGGAVFTIPFIALFAAYFAFIPAMIVLVFAEILGKRDWLFYAIAGGVTALIVAGVLWQRAGPDNAITTDIRFTMAMIGSGLVGGIAYWAVAGRMAGNWLVRSGKDPTSPAP